MNYLRIEMKVCEGCGALWLRQVSIGGPYCAACARHLVGVPQPRPTHRGGRPRRTGQVSQRSQQRRCNGDAK